MRIIIFNFKIGFPQHEEVSETNFHPIIWANNKTLIKTIFKKANVDINTSRSKCRSKMSKENTNKSFNILAIIWSTILKNLKVNVLRNYSSADKKIIIVWEIPSVPPAEVVITISGYFWSTKLGKLLEKEMCYRIWRKLVDPLVWISPSVIWMGELPFLNSLKTLNVMFLFTTENCFTTSDVAAKRL